MFMLGKYLGSIAAWPELFQLFGVIHQISITFFCKVLFKGCA